MRALTHIHTAFSWDSRSDVERLCRALVRAGVELALVCDHNSFGGSLMLRQLVADQGLTLRVPVAAEIRTDRGDVIVVFDDGSPPEVAALTSSADLPAVVRDLGGIVWLPHPFQSHVDIDELAAAADVIEVFNARCSPEQNRLADELCTRHDKVPAFGADVHRLGEVGRFTVDYVEAPSIIETLLGTPTCSRPVRTRKSDIAAAEIVNGIKRRRPALTAVQTLRWVKHRSKEVTGRAPGRVDPTDSTGRSRHAEG